VQEDLFFCRGCGSRFAPQWSPSGRYLVFGEYGGDQRYWLYDIAADQLRPLGRGTLITNTPTWSPTEDLLAYRIDQNGPALLEDMETGEVTALPLEWPVRFDFDGGLLYSPAYRPENNSDNPGETTVYDIARGEVIARLPGISLRDFLRTDSKAVRITERGTVAVLQQAEGCDGTAIYIEWALRYCVVAGTEGQIAADGRVAVARRGERVPRSLFNTNDGNAYWYDIDIVDPSGAATTIVTGAASFDAPQMEWSADGSRLLLMWPRAVNVVLHP